MKDHLARLPASVRRELEVAAERAARRRADEALRESEQRLRQMAENIGDVFYLVDAGHERLHYVSPAYEHLWGRSCAALYADPRAWTDAVHAEDREGLLAQRRAAHTGRFLSRYRITRPDGAVRWIEERGFPILDEAGRVYRIAGLAEDITERVRLEEELRESERLKGAILDASLDCLITVDERGNVVEFNPAAEATFGIPRRAALGRPIAEMIVPERYRGSHERGFARYLARGEGPLIGNRLELTAQRADGSEFPVELAITAVKAGTGVSGPRTMFAACLRDITGRREAEARILRLNRVYATLSAINATIMRVRGREELFREACRIAAEHGNFGIAWVDEIVALGPRAVPVAWAGADGDIRQQQAVHGAGACGLLEKVLRERKPVFINDLALEADEDAPRRTEAVKRGYRSLIVLPIKTGDAVAAVLALLSREPQFFDEEEVRLLSQLAVDISVALDNIEKSERLNYLACFDPLTGLPTAPCSSST